MCLVRCGRRVGAAVGGQLHLANYRFLWRTNIIEEIRSKATAGGQFPSVWTAFRNSLVLALSQIWANKIRGILTTLGILLSLNFSAVAQREQKLPIPYEDLQLLAAVFGSATYCHVKTTSSA